MLFITVSIHGEVMRMIKNTLCIIASIILLSGCASNVISKKGMDELSNKEKAVIVLDTYANIKAAVGFWKISRAACILPARTEWKKLGDKGTFSQINNQQVYLIAPGTYSLSDFYTQADDMIYSVNNMKNIASFTVKGGEVVYLGHMKFDITKSSLIARIISVEDKFNDAKMIMEKYNPTLVDKMKPNHIVLSTGVKAISKMQNFVDPKFKSQK